MFLHRMSFKKVNRSLPQEWHWGLPFTCAEIFKITCAEIVALPFFRSLAPKCLWKPRNYQLITCKAVQETILWATLLSNCLTNYQYTNGSTLQAFRFICCCTLCKKRHDTLMLDLAGFLFSPALGIFFSWSVLFSVPYIYPATALPCWMLFAAFWSWNLSFCMLFAAFGSWNLPCCMLFAAFWSWNFLFCMLFAAFGRRNLPFIMLFAAFARRNLSVCVLFVEFGSWNLPFCCVCCCYVCCCYVCCCAVCCCNVCCCFFVVFVVAMFVLLWCLLLRWLLLWWLLLWRLLLWCLLLWSLLLLCLLLLWLLLLLLLL